MTLDGSPRAETPGPLAGLVVLDFTMNLPGPYATLLLASMGAEVIKVEPPRGDTARLTGRFFSLVNQGKESVALDLKKPGEADRLEPLLARADVVVEGFRPGVMAELGLALDGLRARYPRLITCSISAYGQEGPYRDHPGHDINLQALVGAADLGSDEHGHPMSGTLPVADLSAAMTATIAILGALHARTATGAGRHLDVALTDGVASWTYLWGEGLTPATLPIEDALAPLARAAASQKVPGAQALSAWLARGSTKALARSLGQEVRASDRFRAFERVRLHALPHYGTFRCRDGKHLAIGIVDEDKFWSVLCRGLGLPGMVSKLPLPARFLFAPTLRRLVAAAVLSQPRDHWLARFDRSEVPVTPVLHFEEARHDPQLALRNGEGRDPTIPAPLRSTQKRPAPKLGEHAARLADAALRR